MLTYRITLFFLISLIIRTCGSSNQNSENTESTSDTVSIIQNQHDSMPKQPPPPKRGLPPGFAKVRGEVLRISGEGNNATKSIILLKIEKVLGYGSSTPSIAVYDTLKIHIDAKQSTERQFLSPNQKPTLLIQHLQVPTFTEKNVSRWVFRRLITD